VQLENYSDAALVLLGHGSTANAESGAPVFWQAAELRRRRRFAEVCEAFWKQEPLATQVLPALANPRIFIVPLFISEGYFTEYRIPLELGFRAEGQQDFCRRLHRAGRTWFYCHPAGTHERMAAVLLARAREVVARHPFPRAPAPKDISLFIAGHGTAQHQNSRQAIELQVQRLRALDAYAEVQSVFLEEPPRIADCFSLARTRCIVLVPFFISGGLHVQEDIPVLLGEPQRLVQERLRGGAATWRNPTERHGKLLWYASSIGAEPQLTEVILDRVREAALEP
jgi:sirohydrochlorin cobaltochelatase